MEDKKKGGEVGGEAAQDADIENDTGVYTLQATLQVGKFLKKFVE